MNDRVLKPILEVTEQPASECRFTTPCQSLQELLKPFTMLKLKCQLKHIDLNQLKNSNVNLHFYVAVSLVLDNEAYSTHPFSLKCCDRKTRLRSESLRQLNPNLINCFFFELDNLNCCQINDLYIESMSRDDLNEHFEREIVKSIMSKSISRQHSGSDSSPAAPANLEMLIDQVETMLDGSSLIENSDFNSARLKLQVIINDGNMFDNYLTEAAYSQLIENSINKKSSSLNTTSTAVSPYYAGSENNNSLKILRSSRLNGNLQGNDELFLFCNKFDANDIEVEFFQLKNDTEISWRVFAQIDRTEMHYNCALVIRTPRYNGNILNSVTEATKSTEQSGTISKSGSPTGISEKVKTTSKSTNSSNILPAGSSSTLTSQSNKTQSRVKVYFRLFKPSTKEYSEKWIFYYCPDNNHEFKSLFEENFKYISFMKRYSEKFLINRSPVNSIQQKKVNKRKKPSNQLSTNKELDQQITNKQTKKMTASAPLNDNSTSMETNDEASNQEGDQHLIDIIDAGLESPNLILNDEYEDDYVNDDNDDDDVNLTEVNESTASNFGRDQPDSSLISISNNNKVKKIKLDSCLEKSGLNTNSNDSDTIYVNSASPITMLTDRTKALKIDSASQTDTLLKSLTLEARFDLQDLRNKTFDQQLKINLENCIAKMNALADRTGKALIKFAKTRSLHELMKTQRFLLNAQDEDGNTPMHLCIIHGNLDLLEIIVDVSLTIPYQNLINLKNHKNLTPLLIAAHLGELECCEFLLEANADITQTDMYGCNCIHIACKNKNVSLLKILLKYVEKGCHYSILNSINHDGYAPIHLAVISGSTDLVRELLYMKNLKVNIQDKRAGLSALHHAVGIRNLLQISNLLVNNHSIEIDLKAYNGCTPLHVAIANKNYLITSLLLNHGANLNLQSDMHAHCDIEMFQATAKKNNLLRRCIEVILSKHKETQSNSAIQRSTNFLPNDTPLAGSEISQEPASTISDSDNLNHVKLSEEVKRMYDNECEKEKQEDLNDAKTRAVIYQHNYDSMHYAQNDSWMHEIFKNKKSIKRDLLEKVICYETFRRMFFDVQPFFSAPGVSSSSDVFNDSISTNLNRSKEKLKYLEANKSFGQIKMSQQETEIGNVDMETSALN